MIYCSKTFIWLGFTLQQKVVTKVRHENLYELRVPLKIRIFS
jgi:hypothetical protein